MDLETYSKEAIVTAVFNPMHHVSYPALGLCDETAEYAEKDLALFPQINSKDLALEAGDIMWYFNCICHYSELDITAFFTHEIVSNPTELLITAGKIAGVAKKNLRDGNKNTEKLRQLLDLFSAQLLNVLYASLPNYTLEEIMEMNIAKLRDRQSRGVIKGEGDNR